MGYPVGFFTMVIRTHFVFLTLVALSWVTLWTVRLPPPVDLRMSRTSPAAPIGKRKPSPKPLRAVNLQIVHNATPVDLAYVDVSGSHDNDPHRGARDEQGNWGYVHDETALRRNPPDLSTNNLQRDCQERDSHYEVLTKHVFVDVKAHEVRRDEKRVKIFCIIYSIDTAHDTKIPAIRETWGQKCDGFMVGSNKTDPYLNTVDIPHAGPEIYRNMFQKVRSMWSYVYDYYYDKYDWFHMGGDDMYVMIENLRLYLESDEIQMAANGGMQLPTGDETTQTPLYLGRRFAFDGKLHQIYNSGGPGYTLNKAALKLLVTSDFGAARDRQTYAEDVYVSKAFQEQGVQAYDTKDESGGERYMHYQPGFHDTEKLAVQYSWYVKDSIDIKMGLEHSAAQSVAFHYISPALMRRMHAILYGMCK